MSETILPKLPKNIIQKISKVDPEEILHEELTKKFGNRFLSYRKNYNSVINDFEHNLFFDYPLTVNLELVNRCNLECVMCNQDFRNDAEQSRLNEKTLDKIFGDFKKNKLSALILTISEPLLFKNIENVLKRAKDAEIMDVFLITNGALLDEKKSKMILESCITRLFISLDAATQKTYDNVRVPVSKRLLKENRLAFVENNIKNFVKMRNTLSRKLPLVRVSFVGLKENLHEVENFKKKWGSIVDSVEIQMERPPELFAKVKEGDFGKFEKKNIKKYECIKPWEDIAIYADGTVAPCCAFIGRKAPIGNVKNNTIKEIWNGEKMKIIRDGLTNNDPIKVCQLCLENEKFNVQ